VTPSVLIERKDRVAYVTLQQPDRMNALNGEMIRCLVDAFDDFHTDPEVWGVLITGAGDRAFCAGMDLKDPDARAGNGLLPMRGPRRNLFEVINECGKPVVAAINGWALGAGLEVALACDMRLAAADACLGMPEAKRGMGGNFGAQILARTLTPGRVCELLYLGESISAEQALDWGIVNRVVPGDELLDTAEQVVRGVVANAPLTIRRYKAAIARGRDIPLAAALRLDVEPNPYTSKDRIEGVTAFVERRPPRWSGE
jgi:enoyl-CoA hydratase